MSCKTDENVGKRIGIYDILNVCEHKDNDGHKLYHVRCSACGWENDMRLYNIKYATRCTHMNLHGDYRSFNTYTWSNKRIQTIFKEMKDRCYNSNDKSYRWYGAKGIQIYDEWIENPKSFEDWAVENGYDDSLTIDRINENKDYCPENCRWVTLENNSKYKSSTSLISVDGETHTGRDWAQVLGFGVNTINMYVRKYGLYNTIEFIRRYKKNPTLKPKLKNQSYYSLYM